MPYLQDEKLKIAVVAKALRVSNQTLWRMIDSGEIKGVMEGNAWRIPQSSLRQHILTLLGKSGPRWICHSMEEKVTESEKKSQQMSGVTRFFMQTTVENNAIGRVTSEQAIAILDALLKKLAWRFGGRNKALRDDLFQEMSVAIALCPGRNFLSFYATRAESRARDALRKERRRGMTSFESLEHDEHPATLEKPDCSAVIELFKLAGMGLSLLEEFGIHLVDEGEENHVRVRNEGNDHCDECHDGREEDVHQTASASSSETRAA